MDALRGSAGGIILIIENNLFKFNFGINQKKKKKKLPFHVCMHLKGI